MSAYFESLNRRRAAEAAATVLAPPVPAEVTIPSRASHPARAIRWQEAPGVRSVYAGLRERIALAAGGPASTMLVFTGCDGGEGCTGIVHEFADHLATSGLTVLLAEIDTRSPSEGAGAAGPDLGTLVRRDETPPAVPRGEGRLALVTRPKLPPGGRDGFLRSAELAKWLQRQRGGHDYVLLDAPPILRYADAVLASAGCDGIVLVARMGVTHREALARAREQIEGARRTVLGAVLQQGRADAVRRRPSHLFTH